LLVGVTALTGGFCCARIEIPLPVPVTMAAATAAEIRNARILTPRPHLFYRRQRRVNGSSIAEFSRNDPGHLDGTIHDQVN
jgi:hypothetical protein